MVLSVRSISGAALQAVIPNRPEASRSLSSARVAALPSLRVRYGASLTAAPGRSSSPVGRRAGAICRAVESDRPSALAPLPDVDDSFAEKHTFTSYANWVVPGALMVGRYPFIEPNRCKTRIQGEDQIRTILEEGITVFQSLQGELPDQVKMPIGGVKGFIPFKAVADLMASSMSGPVPQEQQVGLRNPWLDSYLPPRKREAEKQENKIEVEFKRYPITDMELPSMDTINALTEELQATVQSGKKVYMNCWGGQGRAGTVAACYLIKAYGISAQEALQRVQLAFDTRRTQGKSPQNDAQIQFVKEFAAKLQT